MESEANSLIDCTDTVPAPQAAHLPALMLALATVFWGFGFTWARDGAWAVNQSLGLQPANPIGQIWIISLRFLLGATIWIIIFPAARRGWTWGTVWKSALAGAILGAGMIVQHVGISGAGPSVTAFLTSLTILFVPLISAIIFRKNPRLLMWIGVVIATIGIWLMTGARPQGFGWGEAFGLACAVIYSVYLFTLNFISPGESPARLTAGQFFFAGLVCVATLGCLPGASQLHFAAHFAEQWKTPAIMANLWLLTLLPTIGAFGLMIKFQPRIEPTRAALIYMLEPLFAAIYAVIIGREVLPMTSWIGAGLILVANIVTELWPAPSVHPREILAADERG